MVFTDTEIRGAQLQAIHLRLQKTTPGILSAFNDFNSAVFATAALRAGASSAHGRLAFTLTDGAHTH